MKRSFVSSFVLAIGLPVSVATHAPPLERRQAPVVLQGVVTAASSSQAVDGAQVMIEATTRGTLSDARGRWSLTAPDSLRGRQVTLRVRRIGYQPMDRQVVIGRDTGSIDFALTQAIASLEQVVVTGTATETQRRSAGSSIAVAPSAPAPLPATGASPQVVARGATRYDHARSRRRDPEIGTESYAAISENPWRDPSRIPLSTFGVDVDRASWANVRRFLRQGQLPPVDAVRLEEMVNYFPYDYPGPELGAPVNVVADVARAPWTPEHRLVRVALRARDVRPDRMPASNLVFLIDVSGSMQPENKLPLVKQSLSMLVDRLGENDRVALVVYAGAAGLVMPSISGEQKDYIRHAIARLSAGGSTAGGQGLELAYKVATENFIEGGNNRVILATDGDFNVGQSSDDEMERLIEKKRESGVFLTVLGFGMGNYKDSKLEVLADKGNGTYAYIDTELEAKKVFVHELASTLLTVAKDVKLQVEFNPARVASYRLLGYENRKLRDADFTNDRKDSGDMGAGHTVTALYELELHPTPASPVALRYEGSWESSMRSYRHTDELMFVKVRYKGRDQSRSRELQVAVKDDEREVSGDFAFASAVAEFAMLLRESAHRGDASVQHVLARAEESLGEDRHGYRREFVSLVREYDNVRRMYLSRSGAQR